MSSDQGEKRLRRLRVATVFAVVVTLLAGAAFLQYSLDRVTARSDYYEDSAPIETGRSILDVLGGIRQTVGAYLWTKTDDIFHDYLGADPLGEQSLYPYFWLITRLDPHYITPFYFASWMLCRLGKVDEGLSLALEGARQNPKSAVLEDNLAQIYLFFLGDALKAREHELRALQLVEDERDRIIYANRLDLINAVLSGEKPVPVLERIEKSREILEELEGHEHEGHEHE